MLQHTGSLPQQNKRCLPSIEWEVERVQISWRNNYPTSDQIRLWFWAQRSLCFVMFTFEEKCTSRHERNIAERRGEKKTENWSLKWVLRVVRVDPIPRLSLDRYRSLSYGWCSVSDPAVWSDTNNDPAVKCCWWTNHVTQHKHPWTRWCLVYSRCVRSHSQTSILSLSRRWKRQATEETHHYSLEWTLETSGIISTQLTTKY